MSEGRGVLVTGASRGIGAATAEAFAAEGDRVAVHYRSDRAAAERVLDGLPGTGHQLVHGDIAEPDQVAALVATAIDGLDGVDVLVNNAAVYDDAWPGSRRLSHPLADTDYARWQQSWRRTLEVNLLGTANVTWCVARHMLDTGRAGRIINVGSRGAYRGEPEVPAYGASKAGVHALGQSLAVALAPFGIGVASVAPGFVATDMTSALLAGPAGAPIRAQSPWGRVGTVREIAAAILWLASPDAQWASGAVLDLNGASHLR
ncbi:MAG TPA: SDR family oxidoreductase [Mycobacteriales bacterium]|nr:SDR family oxidoreductase [Mycobacteriales bacterium]